MEELTGEEMARIRGGVLASALIRSLVHIRHFGGIHIAAGMHNVHVNTVTLGRAQSGEVMQHTVASAGNILE
jgi:hypothetical protein